MDSQYLIKQDPFFDTRERLIVEERLIHVYPKKNCEKIKCPLLLQHVKLNMFDQFLCYIDTCRFIFSPDE